MNYSFGVPGFLIWFVHIFTGLYFLWLGYLLTNNLDLKIHGIILIVFGALMTTYHIHLWYYNNKKKEKEQVKNNNKK